MLIGYVAVGVIQAGVRFRHAEHFGRLFGPGAVRTSVASRARDVAFGHDPYESLEPRQYGDGRLVRRARDVDAVYLQPPSTANETDEKHQSPDARTIHAILKIRLGFEDYSKDFLFKSVTYIRNISPEKVLLCQSQFQSYRTFSGKTSKSTIF